jgi:hypothetical protein
MGWTVHGSNPGVDKILRSHPDRPWGPPISLHNKYRVSLFVVKQPGVALNTNPKSSSETEERIDLYLYFPSGPSWLVLGLNFACTALSLVVSYTAIPAAGHSWYRIAIQHVPLSV